MDSRTQHYQMVVAFGRWLAEHARPRDVRDRKATSRKPARVSAETPWHKVPELLTVHELRVIANLGRSAAYDFARRHGVMVGGSRLVPKSVLRPQRDLLI